MHIILDDGIDMVCVQQVVSENQEYRMGRSYK